MKLLRNPEVLKSLFIYLAISAAASAAAFFFGVSFGMFTAAVCLALTLLHLCMTGKRYERINALASDIDKILHGSSKISIESYSEGELAILQSEIYKMTVCLREQHQRLMNDKIYLSDSIADISHQIRTPLTSINLLVELLSEPDLTEEKRFNYCCELRKQLSRIDWLITALLKISKLDAGTVNFKKESASLEDLIGKASESLLVPIEIRGQSLSVSAKGNFYGDIAWTCEAIGNILKNCMEHTPANGKITVIAEENPLFSEICISDNGMGISKEDLPHIFERFYKGSSSGSESFGIGLSLARMIITEQNGTVKAENRPQGGAKFTVRFYKGTV